jgi:hypothetical protein
LVLNIKGKINKIVIIVYICIAVGDPIIKRERIGLPLTGLTLSHLCACPKPGPAFQMPYDEVFFIFTDIK